MSYACGLNAWLASLHAVHRRRIARRHFTSMTLLNKEEGGADWVGQCRLTVSKPMLKAPAVSVLESGIS